MQRSHYAAEIEQHIEDSFKAWKWHSGVQHQPELDCWAKTKTIQGISKKAIRDIEMMIKSLRDD
jgi:hypothetical protein